MELILVEERESSIALNMLRETAVWLHKLGSSQWEELLKGEDKHGVVEAIKEEQVYFLRKKEEILGLVILRSEPSSWDKYLWQEYENKKNVYYLHRLMIRPKYGGKKYGEQLLNLVKNKASKEVTEIRLDCLSSNEILRNYYKKNGFENIGWTADKTGIIFELFRYVIKG